MERLTLSTLLYEANQKIATTTIEGKKGAKEYAEVNQRIKAFRLVFPDGFIITELLRDEEGVCVFKATVGYREDGKDIVLGTGTAYEKEGSSFINKTSYIENCETSAVGRALGMCGIGIDTSVASAEEVKNAQLQQAEQATISTAKQRALQSRCEADGVSVDKLVALYKVTGLAALTEAMHMNIAQHWEKVKEACKNE